MVDDNQNIRQLVRLALGKNYEIQEAEDGQEGLRLVRQNPPDILLLDIMMAGAMDGLQVLEVIKSTPDLRHVTVALLTARGQAKDVEYGMSKGADAYFMKPFSPLKLLQWVREKLAETSPANEPVQQG